MYDPTVGRFLTEDPLGFLAGDANLTRYVGNDPVNLTDPTGMSPWSGIAKILGKQWTNDTAERAGKTLATELLQLLGKYTPDSQKAKEIIGKLKAMGWVEETLNRGVNKGQGLILRECDGKGNPTNVMLQWSPGGGHHGPDPYWKFSSPESGTLRYLGGTVVSIGVALIPGAEQAMAGDINGGARQLVYEASPIGGGALYASYWCWLFEWAEKSSNDGERVKF